MRVLMFGWEFPPYSSGGLGTACYGLTKGLANQGVEVTFVIPKAFGEIKPSHVELVVSDQIGKNLKLKEVDSLLVPYINSAAYRARLSFVNQKANDAKAVYGSNLYQEVYRYSQKAVHIAQRTKFDIIHCHDWMTYPAGIKVKQLTGKPLVLHIHATEFDRTGGNVNQIVYDIERQGFEYADKICAVSNFTKQKVVDHYGIPAEKVEVVHNAIEFTDEVSDEDFHIKKGDKIVLFLGRITLQKGPEYFLYAARKVLELESNVKFVVVGTGDMEYFMIEKAAELGISDKVFFAGFMRGKDIDRAYKMADIYVMPSISEPFGLTPLESMRNGTPVIISKQSGVSEVINHCFKIDFWDINEMANKIIAILKYDELHSCMSEHGMQEVRKFDWNIPAAKCIKVYKELTGGF